MLVLGHYGNWEWAGPSFTLNTKFQLVVIYRPLSNPYVDKMMVRMRTKFGTRIAPVNQTLRDMVANRKNLTATAFIADQLLSRLNITKRQTPVALFVGCSSVHLNEATILRSIAAACAETVIEPAGIACSSGSHLPTSA